MRLWCDEQRASNRTIGLIPTMGALHEGHLSLVRQAKQQCDVCVATIFVNPAQFAPTEDLSRYPRPLDRDLELLAGECVDAVFLPTNEVMYPNGFGTYVLPPPIGLPLEGASRPNHFRGVTTVVMKLFQIIAAHQAFFGQKDFQQLRVIEDMSRDLDLPVKIIPCEIVRESDGLAMSSRNRYLSDDERKLALSINQAIQEVVGVVKAGETSVDEINALLRRTLQPCDSVDYALIADTQTLQPIESLSGIPGRDIALIAAHVGTTRLIDNRIL